MTEKYFPMASTTSLKKMEPPNFHFNLDTAPFSTSWQILIMQVCIEKKELFPWLLCKNLWNQHMTNVIFFPNQYKNELKIYSCQS